MRQASVQEVMRIGFSDFARIHSLPKYVIKGAIKVIACRTAKLGGHVQGCIEGHYERIWYNSCKHRICPQCALIQIERWLTKQKGRLLACEHFHIIFTTPHELNTLWVGNVGYMTKLLFKAVIETLFELLGDEKYLGVTPGIIAVLHTWSQTLALHPHIHCLVTGGGITSEGAWQGVKNGFLLPVRVIMAVFRGKYLYYIDKAIRAGKLRLPPEMSLQQWINLKNKLGRKKWNVNIRERYTHGQGVLTYLARYIRGGSISNNRLISFQNGMVTFWYRSNGEDSGDNHKSKMTLSISEFIRRFLLHVPEVGTRVVRYYGLYSPRKKEQLDKMRLYFGQDTVSEQELLDWQSFCSKRGDEHPELCPIPELVWNEFVGEGLLSCV